MNSLTPQRRWWIWLPLLALALWLAVLGDKTPTGGTLVQAPKTHPKSLPGPNVNANPQARLSTPRLGPLDELMERSLLIVQQPSKGGHRTDLFARSSWSPPAPPVKTLPPAAVVAPSAPAVPFIFIGKKLDDTVWEVYLAQGEKSYVLREGSLIDNTYRIDKIAPPNLSLTYLPLGQTQNLPIGESR